MGMFDRKTQQENPEVAECDRQLASLASKQQEIYLNIGRVYAEKNTVEDAKGTPYGEYMEELVRVAQDTEFYGKRRLAVQGLRKCEKCGNILVLDSAFCNKCGEKLVPLFQGGVSGQKVCSKCGTPYQEGTVFCTSCGNKLD